jgi:hypothetical protein
MKAQTSMILIVLMLLIFAAVGVFLLSYASTVSQEDYMDLYVNNLMISLMKTDTGYSDSNCKQLSDTVACAFVLPDWRCGTSGMSCLELANSSISEYMDAFELISKNYRYLFTVETHDFIARTGSEQGEGLSLSFGDASLRNYAGKKRTSNLAIQKTLAGSQYNLKLRLFIARKT